MEFDATFWVLVSFVAFFAVLLWKGVFSKIGNALDARSQQIRKDLDEARNLREEAQALLASLERKQQEVSRRSEDIVKNAKADARSVVKEARKSVKEMIDRRTEIAKDRLTREKKAAMLEIRKSAADVAADISTAIIEKNLSSGTNASKLIDMSISEIKTRLS